MSAKKTTRINVKQIPCYCAIGCGEKEKEIGQKLLIDVWVDVLSDNFLGTDNVKDSISYVEIYKAVQQVGKSKPYSLIEVLAEDLAKSILLFTAVHNVKVTVHKQHIPFA